MTGQPFLRAVLLLFFVSLAMATVAWMAASEGHGASAWAQVFRETGHSNTGNLLLWLNDNPVLRVLNDPCERIVNAPRNQVFYDFGYLHQRDPAGYFGGSHQLFTDDWRIVLRLVLGTVLIYLPLALGLALVRVSGWSAMKWPVFVALAVFVTATTLYLTMSGADRASKAATVLGALSLLTAAVAVLWTPRLTRRARTLVLGALLIATSGLRMFATTKGPGPSDALSHLVFFGESLAVAIVEGGGFLLLVALLLRVSRRVRGPVLLR